MQAMLLTTGARAPVDGLRLVLEVEATLNHSAGVPDTNCRLYSYVDERGLEHVARVCGDVANVLNVPVHLQGECGADTGFPRSACDCRQQLTASLAYIGSQGVGVVLSLAEEPSDLDGSVTVVSAQASSATACALSEHSYAVAGRMLRLLSVRTVHLLSDNPTKAQGLLRHGVLVTTRRAMATPPRPFDGRVQRRNLERGHLHEQVARVNALAYLRGPAEVAEAYHPAETAA